MGMKLFFWLIPLGFIAVVVMVTVDALKIKPVAESNAPHVSGENFPRTITYSSGQTVVIPRRPLRILIGETGSADVLSAFVDPSRLAAWPFTVDSYAGNQEYFRAHPEVQRFQAFNAETILSLKPDLLVCASFQDPSTIRMVSSTGLPILRFEVFHTWAGICSWIEVLGLATGEESKARELIARLDHRLNVVKKAVAGRAKPRVLVYANFNGSGSTVGTDETQDEVIRLAGGINAAAEAGLKGLPDLTFEQLIKIHPDVLLIAGNEGLQSQGVINILNIVILKDLPVVRDRRFAIIPGRFYDSTTLYLVDAVEVLAKQIHPDAFEPSQVHDVNKGRAP